MSTSSQIIGILKENTTQIMAVVFFISLIIISIMLILKKRSEDREDFFKQIMALLVAAFIVISAASISGMLNDIIGNMSVAVSGDTGREQEVIEIEEDEDRGFWQKAVDAIFGYVADAAETAKKYLLGTNEDVGIRAILHKATADPLADYNVPTKGGGTINLYKIILNSTSFLTFIMVINTAYKLMKYSWNPSKREEVVNALTKWAYVIVMIAASPGLFAATTEIMDMLMGVFNNINLDYTLSTSSGTGLAANGILWAILRIVMAFVEFKIYILMIYRIFVINAYYLTSPIAIFLWGVSDNFTAANNWLNVIMINIFSPIAYEITFILAVVLINGFYPNNAIASCVSVLFAVTIADTIKGVVNYKTSGNVLGGMQDVKNVTRGMFTTAMTAVSVAKLGKGIANSKIFQTPATDKKPTGKSSFGQEKTSFENRNTTNAQNRQENRTEQLGKTSINNGQDISSRQTGTINSVRFEQNKAGQLGNVNNIRNAEYIGQSNTPIMNSSMQGNSFLEQRRGPQNINLQINTRPSDVLNRKSSLSTDAERQTIKQHQSMSSESVNPYAMEYPGYFGSSNAIKGKNSPSESAADIGSSVNKDNKVENSSKAAANAVNNNVEILGNNHNKQHVPDKLQIKDGISAVKNGIGTISKLAPAAAGIGVAIATGNPIIGAAASKGTKMAVNATQNIITGGANAVKQTVETVKATKDSTKNTVQKLNKAINSNSDHKIHRRN